MRYLKPRLFRIEKMKKEAFQKILITKLGLNSEESNQVIQMNKRILSFAKYRLLNNCLICQKHEIDVKPFKNFQYCLGLRSHTLEHRINVLKDIGIQKVNVTLISKIISYLNKPMVKFKSLTDIPFEQDIWKNIFSRLSEPLTDLSQIEPLDDQMKVKDYYNMCLKVCKTQIFNLPDLDDKVLLKNYMINKSISMIEETLKVLRLDLDCDNEYIKNNSIVIIASAENVKSLLNNFKDTGLVEMPIKVALKKYPFLLLEDANNIKQLLQSFKYYNISEKYARKCMKIFTLGNDIFVDRMELITRHPDLQLWSKYPRILEMILHNDMTLDHVGYLRFVNRIKWARAQTILLQSKEIDRFVQYGPSTLTSPKSLRYLLNIKLKIDQKNMDLVKELMKHPHWKTIGFDDIEKMLDYLMLNFTTEEICRNIHIILYSRSVVKEQLAELKERYSPNAGYTLTNSQYLALCLYMIEKDTNFTGDGIWTKGHNAQKQSSCSSTNQSATSKTKDDANIDVPSVRTSNPLNSNLYNKS